MTPFQMVALLCHMGQSTVRRVVKAYQEKGEPRPPRTRQRKRIEVLVGEKDEGMPLEALIRLSLEEQRACGLGMSLSVAGTGTHCLCGENGVRRERAKGRSLSATKLCDMLNARNDVRVVRAGGLVEKRVWTVSAVRRTLIGMGFVHHRRTKLDQTWAGAARWARCVSRGRPGNGHSWGGGGGAGRRAQTATGEG